MMCFRGGEIRNKGNKKPDKHKAYRGGEIGW
jgi:hypothetical protein